MNTVLWILQILLALAFLMAGILKMTQPLEKLGERMGWVKDFQPISVRLIGTVELLAAIGLILPALTGILPILRPLAAAGLVLTMIGALYTHLRRSENSLVVGPLLLGVLALIVAYGRFVVVPL